MGRGEYWRLCDNQGRPPGVLGMWPSRAVTFIDNHDTGTKLRSHRLLQRSYLLVLTVTLSMHEGVPTAFLWSVAMSRAWLNQGLTDLYWMPQGPR
jgi:alpha-amylase